MHRVMCVFKTEDLEEFGWELIEGTRFGVALAVHSVACLPRLPGEVVHGAMP